jgi:hypothetical protein
VFSSDDAVDPAVAGTSEPRLAVIGPVGVLAVGILAAGFANVAIVRDVLDVATASLFAVAP